MATWQERVKQTVGSAGYDVSMRRSIQTVLLYEAKRCVEDRADEMLSTLRPFQKRIMFMEIATALLESLDFIHPHTKPSIFWRTATSKEGLDSEVAWKKIKGCDKELEKLGEKVVPYMTEKKSHQEAVDKMVQAMYEELGENNRGKQAPTGWEHSHNHILMTFRLYYNGDKLNTDFPPPVPPREVIVPSERPKPKNVPIFSSFSQGPAAGYPANHHYVAVPVQPPGSAPRITKAYHPNENQVELDDPTMDVAEILGESKNPVEDRRKVLQEVREHLDLLKEFEGVIPAEEIAKRKRELFLAMPPAPPSHPSGSPSLKKPKVEMH